MSIDNQNEYWDRVAQLKTFTHPMNAGLLLKYVDKKARIVDYGCGYGRIVNELLQTGFLHVTGFDTSVEFVNRGKSNQLPLHHISDAGQLPLDDNSVDCFILFAVLTCIPSNGGQNGLLKLLQSKLKTGGYIYISDYYLQNNEVSKSRYTYLNNDKENYGVFTLPEGATLRHHTKEWMTQLVSDFEIREELLLDVKTMNGNSAAAFQMLLQK